MKVEQHRSHLEKRLGAGDIPPKSVDEYKLVIPEALAEKINAEELAAAPDFKDFVAKMHGAGLTQAQLDVVTGEMLSRSMALQEKSAELSATECTAALRQNWATQEEFDAGVRQAYRAASAFGDVDKLMGKYGNDPEFIAFAAAVGKEVGSDGNTPGGAASVSAEDVASMQKSEAYWNPNHPDHERTKAKVAAHFASVYGNKAKAQGPAVFSA